MKKLYGVVVKHNIWGDLETVKKVANKYKDKNYEVGWYGGEFRTLWGEPNDIIGDVYVCVGEMGLLKSLMMAFELGWKCKSSNNIIVGEFERK